VPPAYARIDRSGLFPPEPHCGALRVPADRPRTPVVRSKVSSCPPRTRGSTRSEVSGSSWAAVPSAYARIDPTTFRARPTRRRALRVRADRPQKLTPRLQHGMCPPRTRGSPDVRPVDPAAREVPSAYARIDHAADPEKPHGGGLHRHPRRWWSPQRSASSSQSGAIQYEEPTETAPPANRPYLATCSLIRNLGCR